MAAVTPLSWACEALPAEAPPAGRALSPQRTASPYQKPAGAASRSLLPSASALKLPPPSPLESAFSARAAEPLRQFGYDLFLPGGESGFGDAAVPGAVQGDYALNSGDVLQVTLRGQKSFSKPFTIDRDGRLVIDELRPVAAAGLTLDDLRRELTVAVSATWPNTEAFVSLAEMRRIATLVTGAVRRPGRQEVSAFATVLDALSAAGGVERNGSLRTVMLVRGGQKIIVDLYALQVAGSRDAGNADLRLRDGDRLFVPPLGPTVAVAGSVKHPGIYELPPGAAPHSAAELRDLAGGPLRPGGSRLLRFGIGPSGEEATDEIADPDARRFGDGDLLVLTPRREDRRGEVRLEGHVLRPGPRALSRTGTLADLVDRADLRPAPYLPFAVLETTDATTGARLLLPVDLAAVLRGRDRRRLADGDTLYVLGTEDVDFLTSESVLALLGGERQASADACDGLVALARALAAEPDGPLAAGPQAAAAARLAGARSPCPPLFTELPDLLPLAIRHSVLKLSGSPRPGFYPVAGAQVTGGKAMAGAPGRGGGEAIIESSTARYELVGHVRHPGTRTLTSGTTLRGALAGKEVQRDLYPLLGIIERFDRRSLSRAYLPFSPQEVAGGRADRSLADGDRIHLFALQDIHALVQPADAEPRSGDEKPAAETARPTRGSATADTAEENAETDDGQDGLPMLAALLDPGILSVIRERTVEVRGAVREPGGYPVADRTPLSALLTTAGGLSADADPRSVEVTDAGGTRSIVDLAHTAGRTVGPGDAVRANPRPKVLEARAVVMEGAVQRPGRYDIGRGETLSSLIARAGGLIADAYPAGAVLTRESERRREKEQFNRQADDLERGQALAGEKAENATLVRELTAQLRSARPLGRVVVEADPAVLRTHPELDPLLEPGDRIVIPKRPLTVAVAGEVLHPTSAQFISGKSAEDYLAEAGGPTRDADTGRSFLILPDGRARPLSLSSWNHRMDGIPPGSVLVVPRDPRPFDALEITKAVGNILSQLAITAASVSVIAR
ncbi:SLBB domain-containing protein [Azospirillum picis]|uniref:Protein involved in polysaccharide export with SLBB domain n=1 Tax=Azospirillum picis TaxID=488438 RepID=A0ABU0MGR9_9PROT|nr:SLBB domain-containing protein [Azospirillum picis]MBP2298357.1 protein involved in polysaccharide export with SLBB domain [Azospirillum picis]MDQ0532594.1 protein involved in polysaccharide export with SLBB domain [Azospirillum picis]